VITLSGPEKGQPDPPLSPMLQPWVPARGGWSSADPAAVLAFLPVLPLNRGVMDTDFRRYASGFPASFNGMCAAAGTAKGIAMKLIIAALAVVFGLWSAAPALTQDAPARTEGLRFAPGTTGTTVSGSVTGRDYIAYTLAAEAGQQISIALTSASPSLYFNLYEPGRGPGKEALVIGEMLDRPNLFDGTLPSSGVYTITVFLYRNAAREGKTAAFTLDVAVTDKSGALVPGKAGDVPAGGPEVWVVATTGTGTLRLRAQPSTGAPELARLTQGQMLRNLGGCRSAEGRDWCRVATLDRGLEGWAAAAFLAEAAAPARADALVPGTPFHATGNIPCTPAAGAAETQCAFGVIRQGGGSGSVQLTLPDGTTRMLQFRDGTPMAVDAPAGTAAPVLNAAREGDSSIVTLGDQRFVIPDAVIFGG